MADAATVLEETGPRFGRRRAAESEPASSSTSSSAPAPAPHSGWDSAAPSSSSAAAAAPAASPSSEVVSVVRDDDEAAEAADRLVATVSEAPRNAAGRHIATLQELEGDGGLNVAASRAEGIDLSLLTASLYPAEALQEPDEVVDWEKALQRITQELGAETERREEAESS